MSGKAQSSDFLAIVGDFLDTHQPPSVKVSEPELMIVLGVFIGPSNLPSHIVLRELKFKKWLCIKIFGIALFALVFPKEYLTEAIICEISVIWG